MEETRVNKYASLREEIKNMSDEGIVDSRNSREHLIEKVVSSSSENSNIDYNELLDVHNEFSDNHDIKRNILYEQYRKNEITWYVIISVFSVLLLLGVGIFAYFAWR